MSILSELMSTIRRTALTRRATTWFTSLSARERILVMITALALVLYGLALPVFALQEHIEETKRQAVVRDRAFEEVRHYARRLRTLDRRLARLKKTFEESKMTFEQVTADLDSIVRKSIGSNNYNLTKNGKPQALGLDFEKQDFRLRINSLSLTELVKLLFELEQGKSPLFLGNVDISRGRGDSFKATLEIASIGSK